MIYYLTHPRLHTLFGFVLLFILVGTIIFSSLENWSVIDAFYFTVSTITTVGYGDLIPTHATSKLLASFYMLLTVPLILVSVGLVTEIVHENQRELNWKRRKKKL